MRIEAACVLLALALIPAAYAQESLTVTTNDDTYSRGDTIVVSGTVGIRFLDGTPIIIRIVDSDDNLISGWQGPPSLDNRFAEAFIADGPKWNAQGTYKVEAYYGNDFKVETSFEFTTEPIPIETESIFEVDAGTRGTFDVRYAISGAELVDVSIVQRNLGIVAEIEAPDGGSLRLELPREFIGAENQDSEDIPYIVIIDGIEVEVAEGPADPEFRTITIDFLEGDSVIEVVGTYAVPEFGAVLLVAAAGAAVAAASSRMLRTSTLT